MQKFISKSLKFLIISIVVFYLKPFYLLYNDKYQNIVKSRIVYKVLKRSLRKDNKKIVIIGDSSPKNIFGKFSNDFKEIDVSVEYDSLYILSTNSAIGLIGQYILLNNYLISGNHPEEVFLIYSPYSYSVNLDQIFTYNWFLKPFYNDKYRTHFTKLALGQVSKIPFSYLCREPYILTSDWRPDFKKKEIKKYTFLSPVTKQYLDMIKQLCIENEIKFGIIANPQRESNKDDLSKFKVSECHGLKVEPEIKYMMENLRYFPDSLFRDKLHLKKEISHDFQTFFTMEIEKFSNGF